MCDCPKRNAYCYLASSRVFLSSKKELQTWEQCAFWHTDLAGGDTKNRNNSVVVAKTFDYTQAADQITSLKIAKRDLLHGVPAIPVKPVLQNIGKNIVKMFRLARITERFAKERQKKGPTLGSEQRGGQSSRSRSPNALSYEQPACRIY